MLHARELTVNHLEKPVSDLAMMYRSRGTYEDNVCRCFVAISDVHVRTDGDECSGYVLLCVMCNNRAVIIALPMWLLPLHFVWQYSQAMIDAMVFSCLTGTVYVQGIVGTELSAYINYIAILGVTIAIRIATHNQLAS